YSGWRPHPPISVYRAPRGPVLLPVDRCPGPPGCGVTNPARRRRTCSIRRLSPVTSLDEQDLPLVPDLGTDVKKKVTVTVTQCSGEVILTADAPSTALRAVPLPRFAGQDEARQR